MKRRTSVCLALFGLAALLTAVCLKTMSPAQTKNGANGANNAIPSMDGAPRRIVIVDGDTIAKTVMHEDLSAFLLDPVSDSDIELATGSSLSQLQVRLAATQKERKDELERIYGRWQYKPVTSDADSPFFEGDIVLLVEINTQGRVKYVTIEESNTKYAPFDEEVRQYVAQWTFPNSKGESIVRLRLKFRDYDGKTIIYGGAAA